MMRSSRDKTLEETLEVVREMEKLYQTTLVLRNSIVKKNKRRIPVPIENKDVLRILSVSENISQMDISRLREFKAHAMDVIDVLMNEQIELERIKTKLDFSSTNVDQPPKSARVIPTLEFSRIERANITQNVRNNTPHFIDQKAICRPAATERIKDRVIEVVRNGCPQKNVSSFLQDNSLSFLLNGK
eukprot:TRINITY_DN2889_c0_g1_i2.p1 TRINITY_DN2889_c0_g1~~TRINITY_DN2889_c0_g1_i2.p1  ORF type:complete len:187 (+),score=48.65 TRINITY_DN2889_c0_g1_i2:55-615(+)